MKTIKLKLLIVAILLQILSIYGATPVTANGIAAIVDDQPIFFSEVRERSFRLEEEALQEYGGEELVKKVKEIRIQELQDLIDQEVVYLHYQQNRDKYAEFDVEIQRKIQKYVISNSKHGSVQKGDSLPHNVQREICYEVFYQKYVAEKAGWNQKKKKELQQSWISELKKEFFIKIF